MFQTAKRCCCRQCDNCIIGTMIAAQYLACICWVSRLAQSPVSI